MKLFRLRHSSNSPIECCDLNNVLTMSATGNIILQCFATLLLAS